MSNRTAVPAFVTLLICSFSSAIGQGIPSIPGATSIMKGLPNVSSISPGNAAGVLSYCMKNKVLSGGGATSALNGLMKKPGVASSSGYASGQAGNILTGQGQKFSLNQVPSQMKSQACNAVLKQAPKLL
ncbi:DUF2501 domain-containing protein [Sphingomonas sp. NSE70-1]|uniref:DUF2501 domain-containing protein n=1 Tax=Sphingomonas caseinilyticus TaxID=2908205 RepID=A0ABT0RWT7_9SPHN|nr:DUF2501 domain-containing protein [Sphingomonas caseinilyticus]MCL6699165.1 DUF2501 domain-containing protein [Sphingomonas caseinilyticus]